MRIESKFKDYYDYVAHAYGGGDPKILYLRHPIPKHLTEVEIDSKLAFRIFDSNMNVQQYVLVIAGKGYYVRSVREDQYSTFDNFKVLTEKNFPKAFERPEIMPRWYPSRLKTEKDVIGFEHEVFTILARKINQPVFLLKQFTYSTNKTKYVAHIDINIPILQNYDLPAIMSAEQLYQDISYYICNTMNESPDVRVPNIMSNKEKILQHGFDFDKSFRHRK